MHKSPLHADSSSVQGIEKLFLINGKVIRIFVVVDKWNCDNMGIRKTEKRL